MALAMARTAALLAVLALGLVAAPSPPRAMAQAACAEPAEDASELIFLVAPPGAPFGAVDGPAPMLVSIGIRDGALVFPEGLVTSSFAWGDGASSPVAVVQCPGGEAGWPAQTHSHTYAVAGTYSVTWTIIVEGFQRFDIPILLVTVTAATTPTPTPEPATPTPTATSPPAPTPTPAAGTTAPPTSTSPTATETTPTATGTTTVPATTTATASPTGSPTPSPTPTAAAAVVATPGAPPSAGTPSRFDASPNRPQIARDIETIDEISTDPGVVVTNLVIAGVTVWVLFSSVLLNQVLQANRDDLDRRAAALTAPFRRFRPRKALPPGRVGTVAGAAALLAGTGLIYSLLEPDFGWNTPTAVLFLSALIGVGIVTYVSSGLEALTTRRLTSAAAAVRPFPAAIAIAVISVGVSLALDLRPGVMYGFVASCAVLQAVPTSRTQSGRISLTPLTASLLLAVVAWLLITPIRSLAEDSPGWFPAVLEAAAVCVFIGGIEGVLLNMIPLAEMDGARVYHWNRWLWLALAATSAFLTWHVLFGRERENFSGLREASSVTVLVVFVVYTVLTLGIWIYFRRRQSRGEPDGAAPA